MSEISSHLKHCRRPGALPAYKYYISDKERAITEDWEVIYQANARPVTVVSQPAHVNNMQGARRLRGGRQMAGGGMARVAKQIDPRSLTMHTNMLMGLNPGNPYG